MSRNKSSHHDITINNTLSLQSYKTHPTKASYSWLLKWLRRWFKITFHTWLRLKSLVSNLSLKWLPRVNNMNSRWKSMFMVSTTKPHNPATNNGENRKRKQHRVENQSRIVSEPNQKPKLKSNSNWNQNWIESEIQTITESKPNPPPSVVAAPPLNRELHRSDYDFLPFPSRRRVKSHRNLPFRATNTLRPSMSQPTPPPLQISNNPLHHRNRPLVNLYWERDEGSLFVDCDMVLSEIQRVIKMIVSPSLQNRWKRKRNGRRNTTAFLLLHIDPLAFITYFYLPISLVCYIL